MNSIFLMPSLYALISWTFLIIMYASSPIQVDKVSLEGWLFIMYLYITIFFSILINKRKFKKIDAPKTNKDNYILSFYISGIIGLFGLIKYYMDFAEFFGGFDSFIEIIANNPLDIRAMAAEETSIGFQLSYFSWIAIISSAFYLKEPITNGRKKLIILFSLFLFILNLGFIDRTRPIWIASMFFFSIAFLNNHHRPSIWIRKNLLKVSLLPIAFFFIFSLITKKYDEADGMIANFYIYIVGGLPYMDQLLHESVSEYTLNHTFYPIAKILHGLSIIDNTSSQILEFKNVPFPTNVGTFLQPLFSDGGIIYAILGIPILVIATDLLAIYFLKRKSTLSIIAWSNLIFIFLISFFTPKYASSATYLFVLIYLLSRTNFLFRKEKYL